MRRREFIALMGASVTWPFAALAQKPGRTYRLGGVSVGPRSAPYWLVMFDELRGLVSSRAKTSRSIGATTDSALIWFPNL